MAEGPDRLIIEHLDDETLVYDTEQNEAHAVSGAGAAEFLAAEDDVSRREVLRKLALAGAAAAGTGALVKTIVAPTAAHAQSAAQCGNGICVGNCCNNTTCCGTQACCPQNSANTCGAASDTECIFDTDCCSNSCEPNANTFSCA